MTTHQRLLPFAEIPESFKGLKDDGIYYVDKTGFIPYLISQRRRICVFTRPRRFGKTLMLRTLQTFFEYALDDEGNPSTIAIISKVSRSCRRATMCSSTWGNTPSYRCRSKTCGGARMRRSLSKCVEPCAMHVFHSKP